MGVGGKFKPEGSTHLVFSEIMPGRSLADKCVPKQELRNEKCRAGMPAYIRSAGAEARPTESQKLKADC